MFSDEPVVLDFYSSTCPNLSLIDLPGITKVLKDDKTGLEANVEEQLRKMTKKYTCDDRTIILAVSPANNDLSNSDAMAIQREVDKDG
jgi:hypothetical protein